MRSKSIELPTCDILILLSLMFTVKKRRATSIVQLPKYQNADQSPIQAKKSILLGSQKSSPLLPKIDSCSPHQEFDLKKIKRTQAKQLSLAIEMYHIRRAQHLKQKSKELEAKKTGRTDEEENEKDAYKESEIDHFILDVLEVLKNFALTENNFKDLFQMIYKDIKKYIFFTGEFQLGERYQIQEGETYKRACKIIDSRLNGKMKHNHDRIVALEAENQILAKELSQLKVQSFARCQFLENEVERYKKMSNSDYVMYLEEKIQEYKDKIFAHEDTIRAMSQELKNFQDMVTEKKEKLATAIKEISQLDATIYDLRVNKDKTEKMFLGMRDRFDQLTLKLKGIKETIADVQEQNESLKSERVYLTRRAAVSFQELTPRPQYSKIFNFDESEKGRRLKSTVDIFETLCEKVGPESLNKQVKRRVFQKQVQQFNSKLMDAEKIREQTMSDIFQSKEEMKEIQKLNWDQQ